VDGRGKKVERSGDEKRRTGHERPRKSGERESDGKMTGSQDGEGKWEKEE